MKIVTTMVLTIIMILLVAGNLQATGDILITSGGTSILRYNAQTGDFIGHLVLPGTWNFLSHLVFGPDGKLYVTEHGTDEVLCFNGATGDFIDVFVDSGTGGLDGPGGLVFGPDGNLYVISGHNRKVIRYSGTTGEFIDEFVSGLNSPMYPSGIVFGPDGNLYVCSNQTDEVLAYDGSTGGFIGAFVSSGSGGVDCPYELAFGPDDNLYVASAHTDEVLRYDGLTGEFIDVFVPSTCGLDYPNYLVFGPDGNLYATGAYSNNIVRSDGTTCQVFITDVNSPVSLVFFPKPPTVEAAVDIDPDVLNIKSRGKWITCYVWLPEPYDVADVDPDTILLNGQVVSDWSWIDEAEQMLMAKFPRSQTKGILVPGEVKLNITGEFADGTKFEGSDTIKVIDKESGK